MLKPSNCNKGLIQLLADNVVASRRQTITKGSVIRLRQDEERTQKKKAGYRSKQD